MQVYLYVLSTQFNPHSVLGKTDLVLTVQIHRRVLATTLLLMFGIRRTATLTIAMEAARTGLAITGRLKRRLIGLIMIRDNL